MRAPAAIHVRAMLSALAREMTRYLASLVLTAWFLIAITLLSSIVFALVFVVIAGRKKASYRSLIGTTMLDRSTAYGIAYHPCRKAPRKGAA
jgi:hypothetical protein